MFILLNRSWNLGRGVAWEKVKLKVGGEKDVMKSEAEQD